MVNIELDYETSDAIMVELLKNTYDMATYNFFNDVYPEDLQNNFDVMEAVTVLMKYYTPTGVGEKVLEEIYKKHYYRHLLSTMGD